MDRIDIDRIEREARALRAQELRRLAGVVKRRLFGKRAKPATPVAHAH